MERELARKLGHTKIPINKFNSITLTDGIIECIDEGWDIVEMTTYWYDDYVNLESADTVNSDIWNRDINQCNAYIHNILIDLCTYKKAYEYMDNSRELYFLFCENKEMNCGYLFAFAAKGFMEDIE